MNFPTGIRKFAICCVFHKKDLKCTVREFTCVPPAWLE